jgi:site-specific recombinase XerD
MPVFHHGVAHVAELRLPPGCLAVKSAVGIGGARRALRKLRRDYPKDAYVFVSERGGPISPTGFHRLIQRVGEAAKMPFPIHPHMLRHGCGYALANAGHDTRALQAYLGHKNIQHTVRYTELAPHRFKDFWR